MNNNKSTICVPLQPNQQPSRTTVIRNVPYVLVGQTAQSACYAPMSGKRKRRKRTIPPTPPCPTLCIVGLSNGFSPPPLTIGCSGITQELLSGAVPAPYANQLFVQSPGGTPPLGTPPYIFSLVSGSLPPNITLSSDGLLSGIAILVGTFTFTVQVTDSNGCIGTQEFTITIVTT